MPENQFACIGCGTMNPVGAEVCSGCGLRFSGTEGGAPTLPEVAAIPEAPTQSSPARSSSKGWIGWVVLAVVFVPATIYGFVNFPRMAIVLSVAAVGAMISTWVISKRRTSEGKPLGPDQTRDYFVRSLGGVFLVLIASAVAFVVTCFPIGLTGFEGGENGGGLSRVQLAFGVGIVAAILAGGSTVYYLLRRSQDRG